MRGDPQRGFSRAICGMMAWVSGSRRGRPGRPAATCPAPVAAPGRPVPAHDRRRLHAVERRAPPHPFLRQQGPKPPVPIAQRRSARGSLEHRDLVPHRQVLQDQILPGSSGPSQQAKEDPQHEPHANPPQAGARVAEPLLSGKPLADRVLAPYSGRVCGPVADEVVGPDMVGALRPSPHQRAVRQPETAPLGLFRRHPEPLVAPESFHPRVIDAPAFLAQEGGDAALTTGTTIGGRSTTAKYEPPEDPADRPPVRRMLVRRDALRLALGHVNISLPATGSRR